MQTALLLDAHLKSSLAAARSLGRYGIRIIAGSHRRAAMGLYSRYVSARFLYPSPLRDRRGFVQAVCAQAREAGPMVVLPFSDATLLPLVSDGQVLAECGTYVLPPRENFEIAFDKARTLERAAAIGLEIPLTCYRISEIAPLLSYPLVVKPRHSVSWSGNGGIHRTAVFALSAGDLRRKYATILSDTGERPLIQEYLRGEEAGVEFLCDGGRILAACAHRRIRSLMPTGGAAVLKETVPLSYARLGKRAELLAAELRWSGPIMVEFKIDRQTGVPKLMEANGRFWGSLPLAIAAGVDFPYLYYRLACGEQLTPELQYREGVLTRHFLADFRHLLSVVFDRNPMRPLSYPSRWSAVRDFLTVPEHCQSDILDWKDLKPALVELLDVIARPAKSIRQKCGL